MSDLYRENILDHYKYPRNFGKLDDPDASAGEANPLCGDCLNFDIKCAADGTITDIAFNGSGCAISVASASLLTENLKGKNIRAITALDHKKIMELLEVEVGPGRIKCALLPLAVVRKLSRQVNELKQKNA